MYIEKINGPADVKRLSAGELETLSEEVRGVLLKKLSEHGLSLIHIWPSFFSTSMILL